MYTKVQIIARTAEDALLLANAGTDFIGLPCDVRDTPGLRRRFNPAEVRAIFESLPAGAMRVALTLNANIADLVEIARGSGANAVQIIGSPTDIPPETIAELRAAVPTCKWIRAIGMWDRSAIDVALLFQPVADYLLLDSRAPGGPDHGGLGITHDWSISAEIVRRVHIPIILAGGISPDNAAAAIRAVHPWGLDSWSLTNFTGTTQKDPEKVRSLLATAHGEGTNW